MCILLKLDYAKFDFSNLFFIKSYRGKTFGGSARPPLVKEGLKVSLICSRDKVLKVAFVRCR